MSRIEWPQSPVSHVEEVSLFSVRLGEDLFAIETSEVREVLDRPGLRAVPLAPAFVAGILPYRGEVLTAFSFRVLLGRAEADSSGCMVVLEDRQTEQNWGLIVDEACGVLCLPKESLEPNPGTLDARSMDLFGGVYRTPTTLIVRIDPCRLLPRTPATGLQTKDGKKTKTGEIPCAF